ncbi:MAG TPA: lanthionine synthetase LanC family protein, partial [Polyangiaceae bacterium]|nr:lanthionine synthetase LanC family protein [Polyangiaceae bacterium]
TGAGATAFRLAPLQADLYSGTGGIALFLGYLGSVSREERFTRMAARAAAATRATLDEMASRSTGGFCGTTSQLYALSHLAALWGDPHLLPPLEPLLVQVKDAVVKDDAFDVIAGTSGCILNLLALHEATGNEQILDVATACGRHLAQHALRDEKGASWKSHGNDLPLLGFSHGTAGTACALSRLARAIAPHGELGAAAAGFAALAEDALRFERAYFNAERGNWPHFHSGEIAQSRGGNTGEKNFSLAWCHGAPGIALSRLVGLPDALDEIARREVEIAVASTLAAPVSENQSLCHGELGNLMIVHRAATVFARADWRAQVQQRLVATMEQLATTGPSCGFDFPLAVPSLMHGIAGIGYGLLHFERPDEVPMVLALAPPLRSIW